MSNPLAIRAVTATLRQMLSADDAVDSVSVRPPDRLLDNDSAGRLNLYLFRVAPNEAWRNTPLPDRAGRSEHAFPPLALDLYYLLTAYGDDTEETREHELLGRAMSIFHNNASVSPIYVQQVTSRLTGGEYVSDLHEQIERVRITHDPLSLDDLSKLWNTFQTQYRISTAYRVSVVLIDPTEPPRSVMPVLRRGELDRGPRVFVELNPTLDRIVYRHNQRADISQLGANIGGRVALFGNNVPAQGVSVNIRDPRSLEADDLVGTLTPLPNSRNQLIEFDLDANAASWQAGVYTVDVAYTRDQVLRTSNRLALAIVPEFQTRGDGRPIVLPFREDDHRKLQLEIVNGIHPRRGAHLILNRDRETYQLQRDKQSPRDTAETPVFDVNDVPAGDYRARIRVDGVDSLVTSEQVDPSKPYLEFDPNMEITVQP